MFTYLLLCLAAINAEAAQTTQVVTFPASQPSNAVTVPADFVGFGFETANFNNYTTEFSQNLINSVGKRMSVPPIIRIGGTSGDNLHYDPNQKANISCAGEPQCLYSSGTDFILGPSYFQGFNSFQPNRMTFQAPLNQTLNITNTLDFVSNAYKNLGSDRLAAIAIGSEVDGVGYEQTAEDYVRDAHTLQENITKALNLTGNSTQVFEVLDLASGQVAFPSPWNLSDAFNAGLDSNNLTKIAAEHYCQVDGDENVSLDLQSLLMNHTAIKNRFTNYTKAIKYIQNNDTLRYIPYVLSETGSGLEGNLSFVGSFGACLWSVDFHLYAMSFGVARVAGTQRPTVLHALWTPNAIPGYPEPQVRPNYYAQPYISDFIGNSTSAQSVVEYDLQSDTLTAYAMYSGSQLSRIALVNLVEWSASSNTTRGSHNFTVSIPEKSANSVTVRRLHADAGAESLGFDVNPHQNITWAGEQWSYQVDNGNGHDSGPLEEKVSVTDGKAVVYVPDSEAVVVYL